LKEDKERAGALVPKITLILLTGIMLLCLWFPELWPKDRAHDLNLILFAIFLTGSLLSIIITEETR